MSALRRIRCAVRRRRGTPDAAVPVMHCPAGGDGDTAGTQRRLRALGFEHAPVALAIISASDGTITMANGRFNRLFGYAEDESVGLQLSAISPPADEQYPGDLMREIATKLDRDGVWSGRVRAVRKDGGQFSCTRTISRFEDELHGPMWFTSCAGASDD